MDDRLPGLEQCARRVGLMAGSSLRARAREGPSHPVARRLQHGRQGMGAVERDRKLRLLTHSRYEVEAMGSER